MNPLLDTDALPRFTEIAPDQIGPALDALIDRHQAVIDRLVRERPDGFEAAWLPLEGADTALEAMWSTVSHLRGVADSPELRAAYAAGQEKLVAHSMAVSQNRDLFEVLTRLAESPGFAALPPQDRVAVERALRDFTLSGVALPPGPRERYRAIQVALSSESNEFSSAVLDATQHWHEPVTDPALLAGLSEADRGMLAAAAQEAGLEGWLVTLQQPCVSAVLTFAEDRGLRERVYTASGTRASDQGPDAGRFDNGARIARILALRAEAASLLGYPDPVARALVTRMAPNAETVAAFLRDLAARARGPAEAELQAVRDFAGSELGIDDVRPWDIAFVSDRLRRAHHALDEQEIRAYFPVARVLEGWQALLGRLFGIRLTRRGDVPVWHPDAAFYDVADVNGRVFAGLYLDLHARTGKRAGAWMAQARARVERDTGTQVPVAYLICNFAPHGEAQPSLLSHRDVQTLLHETGHCLHHLFTCVSRPSVGGLSGVEWDAIELPSQLMEDFAWDRAALTAMSGHWQTDAALPEALFARMLAARRFQSGLFLLRQIEFGLFDLLLHLEAPDAEAMAVLDAVRDEVAVIRPPAWHRFPHAFSHIFSGGYAAGYYSYLWAELLAADGFQHFVEATGGPVSRTVGDALREEILSRGAVRPTLDNFLAFRGRAPDPAALLVRHGLAA